MTIKELFDKNEGEALTYEAFAKLMDDNGAKFVDLSEGGYVSKDKFDNELASKESQISTLNENLKSRDKDLKELKTQFQEASGTDAEKLAEMTAKLDTLQAQYKADTDAYKKQLSEQAYEFAVKEFANGKKFSSKAAKRDFERELISAQLKMDGKMILGAEDFATKYFTENEDAIVVDTPPEPTPQPTQPTQTPTFTAPTTPDQGSTKHKTLSELMRVKNENPNAVINFD